MKIIDLLIEIRLDLLRIIRGVENANSSLAWDTTTNNYITRATLRSLFDKRLLDAERFGVYSITKHCSCDRLQHTDYVVENGSHGIRTYQDKNFYWSMIQLYQGERTSTCPCVPNSKPTKHWVIDELVVRKNSMTKRHARLLDALSDIHGAIENAGDKKTRSAIREYLLRAVISLNDGILPQSVDEYIASRGNVSTLVHSSSSRSCQTLASIKDDHH